MLVSLSVAIGQNIVNILSVYVERKKSGINIAVLDLSTKSKPIPKEINKLGCLQKLPKKVDLDFLVIKDGDNLKTIQAVVHSVDGKKRKYHLEG